MKVHITYVLLILSLASFGQSKNVKSKDKKITLVDTRHGRDTYKYFTIPDTNYSKYRLPDSFAKPVNWVQKEKERNSEWRIDFYSPYSDTFNLSTALNYIDTAKDFDRVCKAKSWCIDNYKTCFPYLVSRLADKRKIGLTNTADLIIWDRMSTGDLAYYGHGGGMQEDIFTISGRASWILNDLTGEKFAVVYGRLTKNEAEHFKSLWIEYIHQLK